MLSLYKWGDLMAYSAPASGNSIRFISNAAEVKKVMRELERAALKDVAKFLRKEIKSNVPVDEGILKKNVGSWVRKTSYGSEVLQAGVYNRARARKKGYTYAFHAHLVEFGTKRSRARPFLKNSVLTNIDQIRLIQGKYLKEIENENRARGLMDENEEVADS